MDQVGKIRAHVGVLRQTLARVSEEAEAQARALNSVRVSYSVANESVKLLRDQRDGLRESLRAARRWFEEDYDRAIQERDRARKRLQYVLDRVERHAESSAELARLVAEERKTEGAPDKALAFQEELKRESSGVRFSKPTPCAVPQPRRH